MAKSSLNTVDCVIGGVQKGGTTYLHRILDEKIPELCLSQPKETKIFLKDDFFKAPPNQKYINDKYKPFFPKNTAGKIRIDASPAYFYQEKVAKRIHDYNPSMKWIICLRNPISRCYSHWKMRYDSKLEHRNFMQSIKSAVEIYNDPAIGFQAEHDRTKGLVSRGQYLEQIQRLETLFDPNNIQFLLSANMFASEPLTLISCGRFILDGYKSNPGQLSLIRPKKKYAKPSLKSLKFLSEFYEPGILELSKKLDVDLSSWLSDPMSF